MIISRILYTIFIFFTFLTAYNITFSHALFPDEVVTFIEENPNVTDEELNTFFIEKYGYTLEEYFENEAENTLLYDENFDVMSPSQEYLDLQTNLDSNTNNSLNTLTEKALQNNEQFQKLSPEDKNIFLQNALQLKYQNNTSLSKTLKTYIQIGIVHILEGTDHILFVISLLLLPFVFRNILILISIFTLAHTTTILLAGLNIITLSSSIVEPIIAGSIIVTTLTALRLNHFQNKNNTQKKTNIIFHSIIIFIFGLFHGLGFAGAFSDLNINSENYLVPLLSMNGGVELGQIFIIMIAYPIIWIIRQQKYGNIILAIFSIITIGFAGFWLFERIV